MTDNCSADISASFSRWLVQAEVTRDPAGDLIADMKGDADLPDSFRSAADVRAYLVRHNACSGALRAVPIIWKRFQRWREEQGDALAGGVP